MDYRIYPLGDTAAIIELGEDINLDIQHKVQSLTSILEENMQDWMIEYIPAYTTVTLFYNPLRISEITNTIPYDFVRNELKLVLSQLRTLTIKKPRIVEIPVCYGEDLGPDLQFVADYNQLTTDEVIHIHSTSHYLVYMIGFAPGFPYIGGMSERIATPRRPSPRLKIPPRSVGIAGKQTGIYPIETPGGWQLIGQTPIDLFRPDMNPPSLLQAGDQIKFKPISYHDFIEWKGDKK